MTYCFYVNQNITRKQRIGNNITLHFFLSYTSLMNSENRHDIQPKLDYFVDYNGSTNSGK